MTEHKANHSSSLMSNRRILIAFAVMLMLPVLVVFGLARSLPKKLTRQNVATVKIGTTRDALRELLGDPDYQLIQLGRVEDESTFVTNYAMSPSQQKAAGHRKYILEQWSSREMTFTAIIDRSDRVVCRYISSGHSGSPFGMFVQNTHVTLPPEDTDDDPDSETKPEGE